MDANKDDTSSLPTGNNPVATSSLAAAYGIVPAMASTMCCWGPLFVGMVGGAGGSLMTVWSQRLATYRPLLLGLSATMIGYSFWKVYGPHQIRPAFSPTDHPEACCRDNATAIKTEQKNENMQKAIVWTSLVVAVAGASYGRVKPFSRLALPFLSRSSHEFRFAEGMACKGCASNNKAKSN